MAEMEKEVLVIQVTITGETRVQGGTGEAGMVAFTGVVDCPNFHGVILPGGVDTQRMTQGHLTLSARYMLEGTDRDGSPCRIFIENNGETDDPAAPMVTTPVLYTDSPALQWLETASLRGVLEPRPDGGVNIHIFAR